MFRRNSAPYLQAIQLFLKKGGKYTTKAQAKLAQQARDSAERLAVNPYTWCFTYEPGPDWNSYTANFTACGILHLLDTLGLGEYVPAMCTYDYDMAKLGGSIFTRKYTLAGGGPCCDCHYQKGGGLRRDLSGVEAQKSVLRLFLHKGRKPPHRLV